MEFLKEILWHVISTLHYFFEGSYTQRIAAAATDLFGQLWYFFGLGIIMTALISMIWPQQKIALFFNRSKRLSILLAVFVGVISPIPTYVAIPLIAALYKIGVPAPPLFAFLMSSPLMNPILFTMTLGAFGFEMAFARLITALALGVIAGYLVNSYASKRDFKFIRSHFNHMDVLFDLPSKRSIKSQFSLFGKHLYKLTIFAGKYFLMGLSIAAAVKALIPAEWIMDTLGRQRAVSVLVAVAAGVPLYVCGGGTIPVMQTLQQLGLDNGAILAFFISGPATKLSTLVALKAAVSMKIFLIYLAIAFSGAAIFGYAYGIY